MKITFISPVFESLGVEYISSLLKSKGHQVDLLIDPELFKDGFFCIPPLNRAFHFQERIIKELLFINPDLIAFTVITDNYLWALDLAQKIKQKMNTPIIFGGIHPTTLPQRVLSRSYVDIVCVGEGEYPMLDLAERFNQTGTIDPAGIKNLWYKRKGKIIKNELRSLIKDLDSLPFPDKGLYYRRAPHLENLYFIITARGCPYNCTFCGNNALRKIYQGKGKYLRRRSVDNIIDELKKAKEKWNFSQVIFSDDLFIYDKKWLGEFSNKYKENVGIPFRCTVHPKLVDPEAVNMLREANCIEVECGIQSANEDTRHSTLNRPETNQEIKRAAQLIRNAKINLFVDHIGGIPFETKKEQLEAIKLYSEIRPRWISFFWLTYYPKTDIIETAQKAGLLNEDNIDDIEEGKGFLRPWDYNRAHAAQFVPFEYLIEYFQLLPKWMLNFILRKKLYRFLKKPSPILGQALPRVLTSLLRLEWRLFQRYVQRYLDIFHYLQVQNRKE